MDADITQELAPLELKGSSHEIQQRDYSIKVKR